MQTSFQKRLGGLPNNAGSAHLHVNAQHKRKSETIVLSSTVDPLIRVRFRRLVGQIRTVMGSKVVGFFFGGKTFFNWKEILRPTSGIPKGSRNNRTTWAVYFSLEITWAITQPTKTWNAEFWFKKLNELDQWMSKRWYLFWSSDFPRNSSSSSIGPSLLPWRYRCSYATSLFSTSGLPQFCWKGLARLTMFSLKKSRWSLLLVALKAGELNFHYDLSLLQI